MSDVLAFLPLYIAATVGLKVMIFGAAPLLRRYRCPMCNGSGVGRASNPTQGEEG